MFYIWLAMVIAVICDASGDALMKKGQYILSKTFQMLMILMFGAMIILAQYWPDKLIMWPWWLYLILMYGFIRVGLFNATWGLIRFGHGYWYYLGDTSLYDKALAWIIKKLNIEPYTKHFLFWYYLFAFLGSLAVLI